MEKVYLKRIKGLSESLDTYTYVCPGCKKEMEILGLEIRGDKIFCEACFNEYEFRIVSDEEEYIRCDSCCKLKLKEDFSFIGYQNICRDCAEMENY